MPLRSTGMEPGRRFGPMPRGNAGSVGAYFSRMFPSALIALAPFGPGLHIDQIPWLCRVMRAATVIPVRRASLPVLALQRGLVASSAAGMLPHQEAMPAPPRRICERMTQDREAHQNSSTSQPPPSFLARAVTAMNLKG